jgi:hypothetical protein
MNFKTQIPAEMAVIVCEVREHGHLWPIARIDRRQDQHVHFASGAMQAPLGLQILQQAVELCLKQTTLLAAQQIAQGIMQPPNNPSPAQSLETAASPEKPRRDVPLAPSNEAAASISQLLEVTLPPNL